MNHYLHTKPEIQRSLRDQLASFNALYIVRTKLLRAKSGPRLPVENAAAAALDRLWADYGNDSRGNARDAGGGEALELVDYFMQ